MMIAKDARGVLEYLMVSIISAFSIFGTSSCKAQDIRNLFLKDSFHISSNIKSSILSEVYLINNQFWARFDRWEKDENLVELTTGEKNYIFKTKDSSILTSTCDLQFYEYGFIIPYYYSYNLMCFDTISKNLTFEKFPFKKNIIPYPNVTGFGRNSAQVSNQLFYFSTRSISIYGRNHKSFKSSLSNFYNNSWVISSTNNNGKSVHPLVKYSEIYKTKKYLLGNSDYHFTIDSNENKLYISFQADSLIHVYDLEGKKLFSFGTKGSKISNELLLSEYAEKYDYTNKPFLNLLADSYEEIYCYDKFLIRVYRKGFSGFELSYLRPAADLNFCPSPALLSMWYKKKFEKKMFFQVYNKEGKFLYEMLCPDGLNTFLGFDQKTSQFYFWQNEFNDNTEKVTIYSFIVN